MKIQTVTRLDDLTTLEAVWNELSGGVPFRSFAWLSTWWRCFGEAEGDASPAAANADLMVLTVREPSTDEIVAIVPWYVERTHTQGHVVRWLGSGLVCSDYVSVLCRSGYEEQVADALVGWLSDSDSPRWDALELSGVAADDRLLSRLVAGLAKHDAKTHRTAGVTCWQLSLTGSWDDYLKRLSKTRRKRVRGIVRDWFDSGRAELVTLTDAAELPQWLDTFEDLHQRRRQSLGQPGCFATPSFARFLREVTPQLFESGQFQFNQLRVDGQAVAMDFNLLGEQLVDSAPNDDANGVVYAYQGGVDPDSLDLQPGHLITIAQFRLAMERGVARYDFLRGDEPYKHNWRAEPVELIDYRVVPNRTRARLAYAAWAATRRSRCWAKAAVHGVRSFRDHALAAMQGRTRRAPTT